MMYTGSVKAVAVLRLAQAIRSVLLHPKTVQHIMHGGKTLVEYHPASASTSTLFNFRNPQPLYQQMITIFVLQKLAILICLQPVDQEVKYTGLLMVAGTLI